jgi:hypothetical protein
MKKIKKEDEIGTDLEMMNGLQKATFNYFIEEVDPTTGLVSDKTEPGSPASIASTGLALAVYTVGVERKFITREKAIELTLTCLHFFKNSNQGIETDATGYKGFYYHFLDKSTGKRTWDSELSTIDTALLIMGMFVACEYFDQDNASENEIRKIVKELYDRVDWQWSLDGGKTISHGWKPEGGFLKGRWNKGYSEAHILYALALGSTTSTIDEVHYHEWVSSFEVREYYGFRYIYAGPLFIHQMSHLWIDFREIRDDFTRKLGFDYFENSTRATCAQRAYAIDNPKKFEHYGKYMWGITASDGPGPATYVIDGVKREFFDYTARGAPDDIDDGTLSPWAVVTSIPFAPEIVLDSLRFVIEKFHLKENDEIKGLEASYNATFPIHDPDKSAWSSRWKYGLNQGPIILMIENHRNEFIWKLLKKNTHIQHGLNRAGFKLYEAKEPKQS